MTNTKSNRHRKLRKPVKVILSFLLIFTVTVGGTLAYLSTQTNDVVNTFTPSHVSCEVKEDFSDGITKKNVNVTNTSDIEAYIRVKLVTYRVNEDGTKHIGGTSNIPSFVPGENWLEYNDGFYYYTLPVAPNETPAVPLIGVSGITLQKYTDVDGGIQVIEVMAEAIQSKPAKAIGEAWHVTISEGNVTAYKGGN